ncbi:MAG: RNA-binding transcriptional accessory protein [Spirochaetaceae bacterium 4572_59]|nr:MAG: RNA-binding transcriptional accessory protein [Spirochaetaceae bacterium 4572_59]
MNLIIQTATELNLRKESVSEILKMADEGATVPFMARYRKERTGNLDEVQIRDILECAEKIRELDKRKQTILKTIESQGKLSDELKKQIEGIQDATVLEDLYLPYKPRKKTRGMTAREKGLQPLADLIRKNTPLEKINHSDWFGGDGQVDSWEGALKGASDILADEINENRAVRDALRQLFQNSSKFQSTLIKGKDQQGQKFRDYFEWNEDSDRIPSHRILAMYRGMNEGVLRVKIKPDEDQALNRLKRSCGLDASRWHHFVEEASQDAYKRLLSPSLETETRKSLKERADIEAIRIFSENLKELLMDAPLGQKTMLAVDPGLRSGCKIVCLDAQGTLLHHDVIYPLVPFNKTSEAETVITKLVEKYHIESVATGNGTGGRDILSFCRKLDCLQNIPVIMVSESGASVYSASDTAREEFPDQDVTVRGAVSIGRRLMDPLAELVKIDPCAIGVGQYQHDVDQKSLKTALDVVVVNCVNAVGVELNTASRQLLSYVSGLNKKSATAIVAHREVNGPFKNRKELLKVKGIGAKAFEQASGFLRIRNGENPLDNTGIHPERYALVARFALDLGIKLSDMIHAPDELKRLTLNDYISEGCGSETIKDIVNELRQPGRDPRESFSVFEYAEGVETPEDLVEEMVLPGIVTNVTAFGAFVDIGVHQDGLVHISELADRFVKDSSEIVKVGQKVQARVLAVDLNRKRISLSMKGMNG